MDEKALLQRKTSSERSFQATPFDDADSNIAPKKDLKIENALASACETNIEPSPSSVIDASFWLRDKYPLSVDELPSAAGGRDAQDIDRNEGDDASEGTYLSNSAIGQRAQSNDQNEGGDSLEGGELISLMSSFTSCLSLDTDKLLLPIDNFQAGVSPKSTEGDIVIPEQEEGSAEILVSPSSPLRSTRRRTKTKLSEYIFHRQWSKAFKRLSSPNSSLEASIEITVRCFTGGMCRALPLHLACALRPLPPADFVQELIRCHPDAVRFKESNWGMTALHFAAVCSREEDEGSGTVWNGSRDSISRDDALDNEADFSSDAKSISQHLNYNDDDDVQQDFETATSLSSTNKASNANRCDDHFKIVQHLIESNPDAVHAREEYRGMLPIHIAIATAIDNSNGMITKSSASIIDALRDAWPESAGVMDDWGETAVDIARRGLEFRHCHHNGWAEFQCPDAVIRGDNYDPLVRIVSAKLNDTGVVSPDVDDSEQCNKESEISDLNSVRSEDNSSDISAEQKCCSVLVLHLRGENLRRGAGTPKSKKALRKQPNPFYDVSVKYDNETSWKSVYRSHPVMKQKDPDWGTAEIELASPPNSGTADGITSIKIAVFDCDKRGYHHRAIGSFQIAGEELVLGDTAGDAGDKERSYQLLRDGKKAGKVHALLANVSI